MHEKHGYAGTPTHKAWVSMRRRCRCPSSRKEHRNYKGRGVTVCKRWDRSFLAFLEDMGERPGGTSLDRIDVDGNYEKSNCRWATVQEQARNKRTNVMLSHDGVTLCVAEWAERVGIAANTLYARIRRGWSDSKVLTTPINATRVGQPHCQKLVTHDGRTQNLKAWAREYGVKYGVLQNRVSKLGWDLERALTEPVRQLRS